MIDERTDDLTAGAAAPRPSRQTRRKRAAAAVAVAAVVATGAWIAFDDDPRRVANDDPRGTESWARQHYGDPDDPRFEEQNIVAIDFLGRTMFVHRATRRHFLRLESLFEARAPEYAAAVPAGELDDWSYLNRAVRGGSDKSTHAFGLAVDVNALTNVLGTTGDMPEEVVRQWEAEGGEWGGDWTRPDPMHFETHLTPDEIRRRYRRDGSPRPWYLEELIGG
jgi:hypothetical protein